MTTANYFTQYRSERMTSRNEELLQLDAIISAAGEEDSAAKEDALAMKVKITEITEHELLLENLIKAVGYEDVVVTIGMNSRWTIPLKSTRSSKRKASLRWKI